MIKNDARSYTSDQQKLLRIKAVDMVFREGFTQRATAKALGVSRQHVVKWCKAFSSGSYEALELGRRGRRPGEQMLLQPWQCAVIFNTIRDKTPDQLKMPFVLWERIGVRELIKKKFGITLALRTVGEYLKRWGMTPQRPIERAYERSSQAVENWLNNDYPAIQKKAEEEGATILWGDETGVQNTSNVGRSYSPSGKTPVIRQSGKKIKANMISAITNRGKVRFMIYPGKMNQQMFIRFLERVIATIPGKILLIVDNLKVHHGKKVAEWVAEHSGRIELFYIPSYSPDLNPDEYLNRDLKKNVNSRVIPRTEVELKMNLLSFMRKLQKLPDRVMSYFNSSPIKYAAHAKAV
jgi:transposase